ncbi:integrase core domain protein, partial [Oesophagostomum dentatum]
AIYHVDTAYNPADIGTRGSSATQIVHSSWIQGPQWLNDDRDTWPLKSMEERDDKTSPNDWSKILREEILGQDINPPSSAAMNANVTAKESNLLPLLDLARFSRLNRALRTLALVGKGLKNWITTTNANRSTEITISEVGKFADTREISANDIAVSERILILQTHRNLDLAEMQKKHREKKVFRDDQGFIRYESRLQNADIPLDTKSPILLPNSSELCRLVIMQTHRENAHCGAEQTLSLIRQRFWVPKPSATVSKYVRKCVTCKRCNGLPYGAPPMPPLPRDRVAVTKPFQNSACDFLGPFESTTKEKMYVCLYTCLTTRAVHLEVVENMSTGAFLNCLKRFISRRGVPDLMRSDCGTNFKLGHKIIDTLYESDETTGDSVMSYCANRRITWIFNPPAAPWMGGVWERLVRTVKQAFQKTIGRRKLTFAQMCTVIAEIEAVINTRPLTKVNLTEISELPIRPIDFLQRGLRFSLPTSQEGTALNDPSFDIQTIQTVKQAKEAYEFSEKLAAKFWDRWSKEYLTYLRNNQRSTLAQPRHTSDSCIPAVGEIVLVEQDLLPRGSWIYGKIVQLIESADTQIRSVKLLMPNGNIWHRPLNKVYPLELRSQADQTINNLSNEEPQPSNQVSGHRPERRSKAIAYDVIREFVRDQSDEPSTSLSMSAKPPKFSRMTQAMLLLTLICNAVASTASGEVKCRKVLSPYVPKKFGNLTFNVISVQEPYSQLLNTRYAMSNSEAFIVPDQVKLPVKCGTHEMALNNFRNCTNNMICACEGAKTRATCNCPVDSIDSIRQEAANRLPLLTPTMELTAVNNSITAASDIGEVTVLVESNLLIDSSEFIIEQKCEINALNLTGCYSCQAGARINITCQTTSHTWITIDCGDQAFAVECDAKGKKSEIRLEFDRALVTQACSAVCNKKSIDLQLSGTLMYHPHFGKRSVFDIQSPLASPITGWFTDLHFPDIAPLVETIKEHWRVALAVFSTATVITVLTYLFGPVVVLAMIKFTWLIIKWSLT